ncbi:LOW QUALITY PROTEIN: Single-stranded DNA-binding protein 2, partial [Galemys pyrenaicus]
GDGKYVNIQVNQYFQDYSIAIASSSVLGNIPPGDGMPEVPVTPASFQPFESLRCLRSLRATLRISNLALEEFQKVSHYFQWKEPNSAARTSKCGTMEVQQDPQLNALGASGMPGMELGPRLGRHWLNPTSANSAPCSLTSGNYVLQEVEGHQEHPSCLAQKIQPTLHPNRLGFPMGPVSDGSMRGVGGMKSHHMNESFGSGDINSIYENSPKNGNLINQLDTPKDSKWEVLKSG